MDDGYRDICDGTALEAWTSSDGTDEDLATEMVRRGYIVRNEDGSPILDRDALINGWDKSRDERWNDTLATALLEEDENYTPPMSDAELRSRFLKTDGDGETHSHEFSEAALAAFDYISHPFSNYELIAAHFDGEPVELIAAVRQNENDPEVMDVAPLFMFVNNDTFGLRLSPAEESGVTLDERDPLFEVVAETEYDGDTDDLAFIEG